MHKATFPIVGMLLMGAGVAIGWVAARPGMPISGQNTASIAPVNSPKFWADDEAALAIRSLGYDEAYLYRWQNSHITGWVELEGEGGSKRADFDTRRASLPNEKPGEPLDPGRLSGFVVVAMRKLPSAEWDEYEVRVEQRFDYDMGTGTRAGYHGTSQVGRVKASKKDLEGEKVRTASVWSTSSATLKKYVDGKSTDWFELRVTEK